MPSFEIGPTRPVGAVQAKTVTPSTVQQPVANETPAGNKPAATASEQVQTSDAVKAGQAPVDNDRVSMIRKAIEDGRYPIIPARIADAMIAAGMLWRSPE